MTLSVLSSFEAKTLSAYLKASVDLLPGQPIQLKHTQWLHAVSQAAHFRDWNTLLATAPQSPPTPTDKPYTAAFGIALIQAGNHPPFLYMAGRRDPVSTALSGPEPDFLDVASALASECLRQKTVSFKDLPLSYSRPDFEDKKPFFISYSLDPSKPTSAPKLWYPETPLVLSHPSHQTTVYLWWLTARYMLNPEPQAGAYQSLNFDEAGRIEVPWITSLAKPISMTDQLLLNLTRLPRPARSCYYVPLLPLQLGDDYRPVLVREGYSTAEYPPLAFAGSYDEAVQRAKALNRIKGLSTRDFEAISVTFRRYEEEPAMDDYGGGIYD